MVVWFEKEAKSKFKEAIYNSDGFDQVGFNKNGFDNQGFSRNGFNKDGFNRNKQLIDNKEEI